MMFQTIACHDRAFVFSLVWNLMFKLLSKRDDTSWIPVGDRQCNSNFYLHMLLSFHSSKSSCTFRHHFNHCTMNLFPFYQRLVNGRTYGLVSNFLVLLPCSGATVTGHVPPYMLIRWYIIQDMRGIFSKRGYL